MSNQLLHYSDAELQNELKRRGIARVAPKPLPNPDFTKLIETVTDIIQAHINNRYGDDDDQHYIYEAAVEAVYGDKIWGTLNQLGS